MPIIKEHGVPIEDYAREDDGEAPMDIDNEDERDTDLVINEGFADNVVEPVSEQVCLSQL